MALVALLAAWMLPALHALIHDAAHGALGGVAAGHTHARHCCGHDHSNSCLESHDAVSAADEHPADPGPQPHDHESCDLCKLIAMGLNRLAPAEPASVPIGLVAWIGPVELVHIATPAARSVLVAQARGPPIA